MWDDSIIWKQRCNNEGLLSQSARYFFGDYPFKIQSYLTHRLDTNGIRDIIEMSDDSISPFIYANLHMCPGKSAEVERRFSILKRILMFAFISDFWFYLFRYCDRFFFFQSAFYTLAYTLLLLLFLIIFIIRAFLFHLSFQENLIVQ